MRLLLLAAAAAAARLLLQVSAFGAAPRGAAAWGMDADKEPERPVVKGETQVVSGTNYRLVVEVKDGANTKNFEALVFDQPWEHVRRLVVQGGSPQSLSSSFRRTSSELLLVILGYVTASAV
ncbi:hypothetical protein NL676_007590 [Syzygium grande]|nr:hypothetical protein NL676_007590 [Syzygium grande]